MQSCLCLCKAWAPPGGKGLGKGRNCHTAGSLPKLPLATFFGPVGWTKVKMPLGDILGKKYPALSQLCTGDEESLAAELMASPTDVPILRLLLENLRGCPIIPHCWRNKGVATADNLPISSA